MDIRAEDSRRHFSIWLRTGRWPVVPDDDPVELKFNPYHDPRNGQFTFAPGGSSASSDGPAPRMRTASPSRRPKLAPIEQRIPRPTKPISADAPPPAVADAIFRPVNDPARLQPAFFQRGPGPRRGDNIRAFQDPMTLEQVFPGLQSSPGGTIIGLVDNVFDFTGPARDLAADITNRQTNVLIDQIRAIDPGYRFESLGFPQTLKGQANQIDNLRFDRAATLLRVNGDLEMMKVETLRFIQDSADRAYDEGQQLLRDGKLVVKATTSLALGNYIDREVRRDLRARYEGHGIDSAGKGPIRVNRRENDSSGNELTYRRPDARVGDIAYDVTLAAKTLSTPQVRGFFATDFKPRHVIIIRPRQLGTESSYIIKRPVTK